MGERAVTDLAALTSPEAGELAAGGALRAVSPNGVLGNPAGASAAEGAALLIRLAADLLAAVDAWEARQTS